MGEIFERPVPPAAMPFTGERLTSALSGQTEIEHLHRYILARHLCRGMAVLDVASGEGYGAALLAQTAVSVIGVELAADAAAHASASYRAPNLRFVRGDARALPLRDASVDAVVSFETIEHFAEHDRFLAEIRRVLRPGGLLVLSTPDRDNYSPAEQPANPYHVLELTREEFAALLGQRFAHVAFLLQRALVGAALLPAAGGTGGAEPLCFERRGPRHFEASVGLARPQYVVAVASDAPLPALPASLFVETGSIASWAHALRQEGAAEAERRLAAAERDVRAKEAAAADALATTLREARQSVADSLRDLRQWVEVAREAQAMAQAARADAAAAIARAEERAARLEDELAAQRAQTSALLASASWRVTAPLRAIAALFRRR